MTHKELENAKKAQRKAGASWEEGEELRCIDMMHSILIYNYLPKQAEFPFPSDNYYLKDYIKTLGMKRASELWSEQVADYKKATVGYVGCDSEGCSYNYCKWADE